jgi:hypothetical protein
MQQPIREQAGRRVIRRPRIAAQRRPILEMNTPPIVSPQDWEAARQRMLAKTVKNHLRNLPPGPSPDQTVVPAQPRASKAPLVIALCSGVAAALAWWSYGDAARQMIASSYPQLLWIVPYLNQLHDRVVAGQELTRNTDQITTSVDQAPSAHTNTIPLESRGDAAPPQPTVPLNIKPTEAKALKTLSKKGKQPSAANLRDAPCFPSASAVLQNHPGGQPTLTLRAPGHEGTQCWYAAARPKVSDHRPTEGKRPSN